MKRVLRFLVLAVLPLVTTGAEIENFALQGNIDGENITFDLTFQLDETERGETIDIVKGPLSLLSAELPAGVRVQSRGGHVWLVAEGFFSGRRNGEVQLSFAVRPLRESAWRRCRFEIPLSTVRKVSVTCDRPDLEVKFPGGLNMTRSQPKNGSVEVSANLGLSSLFQVLWKPEVRKLATDLVVSCKANTLATASVGALRMDTVFDYRIIQGALSELVLSLPDINVMQVLGADIQDWVIDRSDADDPVLRVTLARPQESSYRLQVIGEQAVDVFPCKIEMPVMLPRRVIRTSGFIKLGTDKAIKLQVDRAAGVTQVDPSACPTVASLAPGRPVRPSPTRSVFTYQYASAPYDIEVSADDVVSVYSADSRFALHLKEGELRLDGSIELDVKDAPLREMVLWTDATRDWTVTTVAGRVIAESDVDDRVVSNGWRRITVPFSQAVEGAVLVSLQMERSLGENAKNVRMPMLRVAGAKVQRGDIVIAAARGLRLEPSGVENLREIHTASTSVKVAGAQQAYRFRSDDWALSMNIQRASSSIHSEVFHLVSLGEGVRYSSAAITYHISGAPVPSLSVRIPEEIENIEVVGGGIDGWTREGDLCEVQFENRVIADYTLLVTYDAPFAYAGANIEVGRVSTVGTQSEVGFIAIASSANIQVRPTSALPATILPIKRDEIPAAYLGTVTAPVIGAYRYTRAPDKIELRVEPYPTERLLDQVADYVTLNTRISYDGESVTVARFAVKNASRQFLVVRLPAGASLWSVRRVEANGETVDLSVQKSEDGLLIPVDRQRELNEAITLEVEYADAPMRLGLWARMRGGYQFQAPVLVGTPSTFTSWRTSVSDREAIVGTDGNMTSRFGRKRSAVFSAGVMAYRTLRALVDGIGGFSLRYALSHDRACQRSTAFTRTANLHEEDPLSITVRTVPHWLGSDGSPALLLSAGIVGVLLLVLAVLRRKVWTWALSIALLATAFAQVAILQPIMVGVALVVGGLLCVLMAGFLLMKVCVWTVGAVASVGRRRKEQAMAEPDTWRDDLFVEEEASSPDENGDTEETDDREDSDDRQQTGGFFLLKGLMLLAALMVGLSSALVALSSTTVIQRQQINAPVQQGAQIEQQQPVQPRPGAGNIAGLHKWSAHATQTLAASPIKIRQLSVDIQVPAVQRDKEQSAAFTWQFEIEAEEEGRFLILSPDSVLLSDANRSKHVEIIGLEDGFWAEVKKAGRHTFSVTSRERLAEQQGGWSVPFPSLDSVFNTITATLAGREFDVELDGAVFLKVAEQEEQTQVKAVLGKAALSVLRWRPRARQTSLEEAAFYCDIKTLARMRAGVVDLESHASMQIAQGEVREFSCRIPNGMSVTSVKAPSLATWSFDPADNHLQVVLSRAVTGAFELIVGMQVSCSGLPYDVLLGVPSVEGAKRQRGALAVTAPEAIQIIVGEVRNASAMNVEDFAWRAARKGKGLVLRRAYRYSRSEAVRVGLHAEQVLPELRVTEQTALSIADERTLLSSRLNVSIAKVGVFSVTLELPQGFEVEGLTGQAVSHWDELADKRGVQVFFKKRVLGETELNLSMARLQRGIPQEIQVPRIRLLDAHKQVGRMVVNAEQGVRLRVQTQRGASANKVSNGKVNMASMVIDIIRADWNVVLDAEVQPALVRPEVLHHVDLSEGMVKHTAYVRYKIENAGVKQFVLRAPVPGITLSVSGRNISRVHPVEGSDTDWMVELHGKKAGGYELTASCQVPVDPAAGEVTIQPLGTVDTAPARGFVAVTGGERVQLVQQGPAKGLKVEDARSIPDYFRAGDLSSALLSYRTLRPDYDLNLSVIRHEAADVLPALVKSVEMTTVMAGDSDLLGRAIMQLSVGDMRYLKMALPTGKARLWAVLVNGAEVRAARDGQLYNIPLDAVNVEGDTRVEIVYAGKVDEDGDKRSILAPRFVDLPLNNINWHVFVSSELACSDFGGNVPPDRMVASEVIREFDKAFYIRRNARKRDYNMKNAQSFLVKGKQLAEQGNQYEARQTYEQALNYSPGDSPLNEDARIQYRGLVKQQAKMGLVNRRVAVRMGNNIFTGDEQVGMSLYNEGNFTTESAEALEGQLDEADNRALDLAAEKIVEQQAEAKADVAAINVTMPEHGKLLSFSRELQNERGGKLEVSFKVKPTGQIKFASTAIPVLALFLGLWVAFGLLKWMFPGKKKQPVC